MKLFLLLGFATFVCGGFEDDELHIAGLFYDDSSESERAFTSIVALTDEFDVEKTYKGLIHKISSTDVYSVTQLLCNLTASNIGLVGVFSPGKPGTNSILQSITSNLEIPYMHVSWTPMLNPSSVTHMSFFPDSDLYVKGLGVIVDHLMWNSFVVLYESYEGLIRLQDVLKIKNYSENKKLTTIALKQLGPGPDYRGTLKELKNTSDVNIILDCETEHVMPILMQAKEMKRLNHFHNYFITSLDAHTLDYSVLNTTANITTVRIVDPNDPNLIRASEHWTQLERNKGNFNEPVYPKKVKTEEALTYDALHLFLEAIKKLYVTQPIKSNPLSCQESHKWPDGFRIVSYMKQLDHKTAITGPMAFNNEGNRINFVLQLVERKNENFQLIAKWSPNLGSSLNYTRTDVENLQQIEEDLQKMTVIVASRIGAPYLRMAPKTWIGDKPPHPNDLYEGYSKDLIQAISERLNFSFELVIVKDYGKYDPQTKQWTGLIRELLDRRAHLAICDFTITYERQEVIDFSSPFMSLGISILYKKATKEPPSLLQFMAPFSFDVWMYTATIYLGVSIMLYFIARMAPGDWENPHPCDQNPEELENIWTLKNCMWLILGSLMTQGCDILPKGISSRMTTSMWWFFAIIMANSYMANLAAFLTADKMGETIDSVEALAKQTKIKYGTLEGGSTEAFFRNSNFSTYQRMWTQMLSSKPSVFEKTNAEGVNRVKTTKNDLYAFLMESSSIEYEVQRNCDLKQVGTWLDNKNYGIAMPMNSRYRSSINRAILELSEQGKLKDLKQRWWKEKNLRTCVEVDDTNKSGKLALENVGGVFLVLGVGISVAILLAIIEFLWNVRDISVDEHISYCEALKHELKFTFNIWEVKKKAKIQLSESSSSSKSNIVDTRSVAGEILHGASSFLNINALNRIGLINTQKDD